MNDDWRLQIDLREDGDAHRLSESLQASELEHDLQSSFHDRVVVSVDGPQVFLYCGDRAQADAAERVVRRLAGEQHWDDVGVELRHWHAVAEIWEDPDNPEPRTAEQTADEESIRNAVERRQSAEEGYPEFEVRIHEGSWSAAHELSERLREEGLPNVHRWRYVLVGAADEDGAQALAQRLGGELGDGAEITVETNPRLLWDNAPGNPFAVLGGLAG